MCRPLGFPSAGAQIASAFFLLLLSSVARAEKVPLDPAQSALKFTGHAFLHDFSGEARAFRGDAQIDAQTPELVQGAKLEIAAARMTTFETARDRNMETWLRVDSQPEIRFDLTRVLCMDGRAARATREHPSSFVVRGNFTLNRTTRPIQTQVLGWREGAWLVITGATTIDTTAYGLPLIRQVFLTVQPEVDVTFRLVFNLPPALRISAVP